jgi:hypothetical protein
VEQFDTYLAASTFYAPIPGPDRKRTIRPYQYHVTYCNDDPHEPGCVLAWEVAGGRVTYQIALEREENGELRWHCTCADAIYRDRICKHVRGLLGLGRPTEPMTCTSASEAA